MELLYIAMGLPTIVFGLYIDNPWVIALGAGAVAVPLLVAAYYLLKEGRQDDYWVIEPSAVLDEDSLELDPDQFDLEDGPGTCPTCGGTLFYGRLNCPHCSAPVFRSDEG
ncbi:MAG: hypothetical protein GWN18_06620, partial [Thermoplasmata archaeon]|nr:hypothetical protein [Thermoplasmata archaeon]NIS21609.1 hypothetical protein [Thermoplasmata archaeon]NIT76818.1 hypothetical protein [Thermoplasmata archaeon]NIU48753.1 hypothetical protein [Thermoplasmata archaeon]NIW82241.1 hypothetical protein [Thermoplasmata archaeon]